MKRIVEHIKTGTFPNYYLFYGEETYLSGQMKRKLIKALVSPDDTMNYSVFEGKKADTVEILELAETLPFMNEHRLIVLEGTGLGRKADDAFIKGLANISDTTVIIFLEDTIDKRSKIYKYIQKQQGCIVEFSRLPEKQLITWITQYLKRHDKSMDLRDVHGLLYLTGTDMHTIQNELDKLIAFSGGREKITGDDMEQITSGRTVNQIFLMIESIAKKQRDQVLAYYYDLIELRESPFGILALLERQWNQMISCKSLEQKNAGKQEMARQMKIPPFAVEKTRRQSALFSMNQLYYMLELCAKTDFEIKQGMISDRTGVELLLIDFSRAG